MLIIELVLLVSCVVLLWRPTLSRRAAGGILLGLAAISFFGDALLRAGGDDLRDVELPASFNTTTITATDGRRIALVPSLGRVQRYSEEGVFERGWFIVGDTLLSAKKLSLGLTTAGQIVIASDRTRSADVYTADGRQVGANWPYQRTGKSTVAPALMTPDQFVIDGLTLVSPQRVGNSRLGWGTILPALFLHSWCASALAWVALKLLWPGKSAVPARLLSSGQPLWRSHTETTPPEDQVSAWAMGGNLARMFVMIVLAILVFVVAIAVPFVRLVAG
jgi:hypothetical protein